MLRELRVSDLVVVSFLASRETEEPRGVPRTIRARLTPEFEPVLAGAEEEAAGGTEPDSLDDCALSCDAVSLLVLGRRSLDAFSETPAFLDSPETMGESRSPFFELFDESVQK